MNLSPLISLSLLFVFSSDAVACRCPKYDEPLRVSFESAESVVFAQSDDAWLDQDLGTVKFSVLESWKGDRLPNSTFTYRFGTQGSTCEYFAGPGNKYLLFLYTTDLQGGKTALPYAISCDPNSVIETEIPTEIREKLELLADDKSGFGILEWLRRLLH